MISFGNLTTAEFVQRYWQKEPLLVRQALAKPQSLITPETLLNLGRSGQCESRLIEHTLAKGWKLTHGPITKLPSESSKTAWTILTQAVDTQIHAIADLINEFRFAGDALLDDVMISYANHGGGVGPHVDSYDVFLIQLHGTRRWQIKRDTNPKFIEGLPLKILKHFKPSQEWLLEPGDMLYLPAGWAHDGVAVGTTMTASVGFRAPSPAEWVSSFLIDCADNLEQVMPSALSAPRFHQKLGIGAKPEKQKPAQIGANLEQYLGTWVQELTANPKRLARHAAEFSGRYLTEPKPAVVFAAPNKILSLEKFVVKSRLKGLKIGLGTRVLYNQKQFFINGESFQVNTHQITLLAKLANQKTLSGNECANAHLDLIESLHDWYLNGWIIFNART